MLLLMESGATAKAKDADWMINSLARSSTSITLEDVSNNPQSQQSLGKNLLRSNGRVGMRRKCKRTLRVQRECPHHHHKIPL